MRGLYAITPESETPQALLDKVRAVLDGGVAMLQYRKKPTPDGAEASALLALARRYGVPLVVNDDIELALGIGADGVHLGRDDGDLRAARERLAGRLLGVSCYGELERARAAVAAGADYVAFGSIFASPTKPDAPRAPLSLFAAAKPLGVPLAAIGGITLDNAPAALGAGADLLAVITDLFDAPDPAARARQYRELFRR